MSSVANTNIAGSKQIQGDELEHESVEKLRRRYEALRKQKARGRCANDIKWLKKEIRAMEERRKSLKECTMEYEKYLKKPVPNRRRANEPWIRKQVRLKKLRLLYTKYYGTTLCGRWANDDKWITQKIKEAKKKLKAKTQPSPTTITDNELPGWTIRIVVRKHGKHAGQKYKMYYAPSGTCYRSRTDALKAFLAESGDREEQFKLAHSYHCKSTTENDVDKDKDNYRLALKWYKKAADQGHSEAMFRLGGIFDDIQLYFKAAEQGHINAKYNIACSYFEGKKGLDMDKTKAVELWTNLAKSGDCECLNWFHLNRALCRVGVTESLLDPRVLYGDGNDTTNEVHKTMSSQFGEGNFIWQELSLDTTPVQALYGPGTFIMEGQLRSAFSYYGNQYDKIASHDPRSDLQSHGHYQSYRHYHTVLIRDGEVLDDHLEKLGFTENNDMCNATVDNILHLKKDTKGIKVDPSKLGYFEEIYRIHRIAIMKSVSEEEKYDDVRCLFQNSKCVEGAGKNDKRKYAKITQTPQAEDPSPQKVYKKQKLANETEASCAEDFDPDETLTDIEENDIESKSSEPPTMETEENGIESKSSEPPTMETEEMFQKMVKYIQEKYQEINSEFGDFILAEFLKHRPDIAKKLEVLDIAKNQSVETVAFKNHIRTQVIHHRILLECLKYLPHIAKKLKLFDHIRTQVNSV